MEVKSISKNFFRTKSAAAEKIESKSGHSNPFGVSFKGNIINADVFTKSAPDLAEKVANKGKMWTSTIVGSINNASERIRSILSPVSAFGRRIKENTLRLKDNTVDLCRNINDTVLSINLDFINYSSGSLGNRNVSDLSNMLIELKV